MTEFHSRVLLIELYISITNDQHNIKGQTRDAKVYVTCRQVEIEEEEEQVESRCAP